MKEFNLGGGGSNRDTLQAAIQSKYEPLEMAAGAAKQGAEAGLGSYFGKQMQRQKSQDTLSSALGLAQYNASIRGEADAEAVARDEDEQALKAQAAEDEMGGEEQAMLDHYQNVLGSYEPGSDEYNGALRALETYKRSSGGSVARRKGYMKGISGNNFMDAFAQGTLGMESSRPVAPQPDARDQKPVRSTPKGFEGLDDDLND